MLKKVMSASVLVLCGLAMGCNESSPASNAETTERSTTITANRPVTTDLPTTKAESEERTNAGVTLYDRDRKVKAPIDRPEKPTDPQKSPRTSETGSSK
jgi:type 1 fimbria pilin